MGVFWRKSQKKEEERNWSCQDDPSEIASVYLLEDSIQVTEVVAILLIKEVILNSAEDEVPWVGMYTRRKVFPICAKGPGTGSPLCQDHPAR